MASVASVVSPTGQCAFVPNAGTALLNCPAGQCNYETSGNANLKPETSDTKTFGIVFTPTFFDGFTATVDYFDIKVADYISLINPNNTLEGCYGSIDGLGNTILPSAAQVAFFCPFVQRSANGTIFGAGFVEAHGINLGYLRTKGWDMEANYSADLADWAWATMAGWRSTSSVRCCVTSIPRKRRSRMPTSAPACMDRCAALRFRSGATSCA